MNKQQLKEIMRDDSIVGKEEAENAINFVRDLIIAQIESEESSGYKNRLGTASEIVFNLFDILEELDN